jgi:V8-like Glu-specific endopeptidase
LDPENAMHLVSKLLGVVAVVALAAGCANADAGDGGENTNEVGQAKIIGKNDLTPVLKDGANIPAKYGRLVDTFGILSMGCSATHIGNGLVLTAGHCFHATSTRKDNVACPGVNVKWGFRKDKAPYMTSTCSVVLAMEQSSARDYAIFKVEPVPPVAVEIDDSARPAVDTSLTIFGHPQLRPLEWSKVCLLKPSSAGGWGLDQFSHQCDTEPGNSGSSILDDSSLKVVGIHDGGNTQWNYGTYLYNTPIAEFAN